METKELTQTERTATALLRSGNSWKEAAQQTGISTDRLRELWDAEK